MTAHVQLNDATMASVTAAPALSPFREPVFSPARFGWAGVLSLALHVLVGVAVMGVVVRAPQLTAPIRVSLYNPPPPPPAPSTASAVPSTAEAQPLPQDTTHPIPKPLPHRIRRPAGVLTKPVPPPVEAAVHSQVDATEHSTDGVAEGTRGGVAGGSVGGTGHTLLPAEEAALQPVAISKVMPEYPPVARLRGIEGQVVLEAILAADGHVEPDITVVQSVPLLDNAAITALRQWRFRPARNREGEPLRVTFRIPVRFQLR